MANAQRFMPSSGLCENVADCDTKETVNPV